MSVRYGCWLAIGDGAWVNLHLWLGGLAEEESSTGFFPGAGLVPVVPVTRMTVIKARTNPGVRPCGIS